MAPCGESADDHDAHHDDGPFVRDDDKALYRRLADAGFAGKEYAGFMNDLALYGIAVCGAWLLTGPG